MKEYKMIYLNKGLTLSREKELSNAESVLNQRVAEGWTLQQIVSPSDCAGALIAVIYREN